MPNKICEINELNKEIFICRFYGIIYANDKIFFIGGTNDTYYDRYKIIFSDKVDDNGIKPIENIKYKGRHILTKNHFVFNFYGQQKFCTLMNIVFNFTVEGIPFVIEKYKVK